MNESRDVLISIKEINEISFNLKPLPIPIEEVVFGKNLIYGIGFNLEFDVPNEILKLKLLVNYTLNEINENIVSIENEIVFHIINLNDVVKHEADASKLSINDDFLATLLGVCIGTSRGILSTKTKGTPIARFPLPILNAVEIIKQMKTKINTN